MNRKKLSVLVDRLFGKIRRYYWSRKHAIYLDGNGTACNTSNDVCEWSYNKYGGYCVPKTTAHRPASKKVLNGAVHEPKTIEFIASKVGDGDVVHAGTYFGDFLPALSKSCNPKGIVWAFEPNAVNYGCAKCTVELNGLNNVNLLNAGVGSECSEVQMKTIDEKGRSLGGGSYIVGSEVSSGEVEIVKLETIDSVVPEDRYVTVLQLDVEGHEIEALKGAILTIQRCRPVILLEVLPQTDIAADEWFISNILDAGYNQVGTVHRNAIYEFMSKGRGG